MFLHFNPWWPWIIRPTCQLLLSLRPLCKGSSTDDVTKAYTLSSHISWTYGDDVMYRRSRWIDKELSTYLILRCWWIVERFPANIAVEAGGVEDSTPGSHFFGLIDGPAAPLASVLVARVGLDPGRGSGVQRQRRVPDLGVACLAIDLLVKADINLEQKWFVWKHRV